MHRIHCNLTPQLTNILLLEDSGVFFLCYLLQRSMFTNVLELFRVFEHVYLSWLRCRSITKREKQLAREVFPFEVGSQSAIVCSTFCIILVFHTFSPLVLYAGVFYFFTKLGVDFYNMFFAAARPKAIHSGLRSVSHRSVNVFLFCLLCYQWYIMVFFTTNGSRVQLAVVMFTSIAIHSASFYYVWYRPAKLLHAVSMAASFAPRCFRREKVDSRLGLLEGKFVVGSEYKDPRFIRQFVELTTE